MTLTAGDIMKADVVKVSASMPLTELDRTFLDKGVGAFPVEKDGEIVGIVSRSDVVRQLSLEQSHAEILVAGQFESLDEIDVPAAQARIRDRLSERIGRLTVESLMIENPASVTRSTPVREIAATMVSKHVHRLLVIEGHELVGIISSLDLAGAIADARLK